jgi:hypothetical protein
MARFIGPPFRTAESQVQGIPAASHTLPSLWFRFDYTGIAVQYVAFLITVVRRGPREGEEPVKQGKDAWLAVACLLLAAVPAFAHHSFGAEYDGTKPVTLTGVITSVQWTNPHFYFFMDVKDQNGAVANWKFEGYPPPVLNRIGWKRNETMLPGDTVTVFGWRARDGSNWGHSRQVTFAKTGKKLESGPPAGQGDGGNTPPVVAP